MTLNTVAPRFFETMGLPLLLGRDLEWNDRPRPRSPLVVVVNRAFQETYFAGKNPVGMMVGFNCPANPAQASVIGVVGDSKKFPRAQAGPAAYIMMGGPGNPVTLILRTMGDPAAMVSTVRQAMAELDANVPTFGEITPIELREQQIKQERLLASLLASFGSVALFLACLGIYGMLAYSVSRRTSEIGIRMALGAKRPDVVRMVAKESLAPVAAGILFGLGGTFVLSRLLESFLFGVGTNDPWTIAGASVLFLVTAAVAGALPAARASRIAPMTALRHE